MLFFLLVFVVFYCNQRASRRLPFIAAVMYLYRNYSCRFHGPFGFVSHALIVCCKSLDCKPVCDFFLLYLFPTKLNRMLCLVLCWPPLWLWTLPTAFLSPDIDLDVEKDVRCLIFSLCIFASVVRHACLAVASCSLFVFAMSFPCGET